MEERTTPALYTGAKPLMAKDKDLQRGQKRKRTRHRASSSSSSLSPSYSSSSGHTSSSQSPDHDSRRSKHRRSSSSCHHRDSSSSRRKGHKSSRKSSRSGSHRKHRRESGKRAHRKGDDDHLEDTNDDQPVVSRDEQLVNENKMSEEEPQLPAPKKRIIGPAMPSRELLEATAELTEAANSLREADIGEESDVLIGPPPPALVSEVESANEAERFEEVTRIMAADANSPYDILGINWKMASENMKKKYWKLSLVVHPDKCSHPQARQAFVILHKAFKDLQDPNKRGAIDDKLKAKEEQERFEVELKAMREAAQWRKIQGITMEAPKREEWMTTLPPERKPGMHRHSTTSFSKSGKEGSGDRSAWTDTPLDKANKLS